MEVSPLRGLSNTKNILKGELHGDRRRQEYLDVCSVLAVLLD